MGTCASLCPVQYPVWDEFDMLCLKHHKRGTRCYINWTTGVNEACQHPIRFKYEKEAGVKPCTYYPSGPVNQFVGQTPGQVVDISTRNKFLSNKQNRVSTKQ